VTLAALTYSAMHKQEDTNQLFAAATCPKWTFAAADSRIVASWHGFLLLNQIQRCNKPAINCFSDSSSFSGQYQACTHIQIDVCFISHFPHLLSWPVFSLAV